MEPTISPCTTRNPSCEQCALHAGCKTVCLWGEGPLDARVVVVGQNPTGQDDSAGRPFVGPSGKLLDQLLSEAGIDRTSDVYVTNAVKCMTPNNREPSPAETKKCKPYLDAELDRLRPKVIITLGNTALKAVTGKTGVTKQRGNFLERNGVPVISAFHPAYALRSPQFIGELKADFLRAATFLNPIPPGDIAWQYGGDDTEHDYDQPVWAFDIETNGKELDDPALEVLMLGVNDGRTITVYVGANIKRGYEKLVLAAQRGIRIWGHNSIGFDCEVLYKKYGIYFYSDDTMILSHCIDENAPLGLEAQCCTNCGVKPWKKQVTWEWARMSADELRQAATYNAEDCHNTMLLVKHHVRKGRELGIDKTYEITQRATQVFDHSVNRNGIAINLPALRHLKDELRCNALDAQMKFEQIVGHQVNLGSYKQVGQVLYNEMGLPVRRYTDTGQPATDEYTIKTLKLDVKEFGGFKPEAEQALDALLKCRENTKLASMLSAYEEKTAADGRLYFNTFTWRTTTGRTTADQGFQQWPHDKRVRGLLTAPEGWKLIEIDYAQLQMRLAAEVSQSPSMTAIFREGIDPHTFMAARLTGKIMADVTSEERYVAKPVNFGLLFGGDDYTLQKQALLDYDLVLTREEAKRFSDIFHETMQLEPWYARVATELKANGCVRAPLGAIRHLPNIYAGDSKMRVEALRQAINFPVQNFEVMIAYIALWETFRRGLRIVAFLHDAIYLEVPDDYVPTATKIAREVMVSEVPRILSERYDLRLAIPLDVDIKVK